MFPAGEDATKESDMAYDCQVIWQCDIDQVKVTHKGKLGKSRHELQPTKAVLKLDFGPIMVVLRTMPTRLSEHIFVAEEVLECSCLEKTKYPCEPLTKQLHTS